jgi:TPR repeat protein
MASCTWLGVASQNGWGTPIDAVQAATFFRKGCDGGEASACRKLAVLYRNGLGVPVDDAQAMNLEHKSCDAGDKGACTDLKAQP